ncbi:Outer membrane usher protein FIMD [Pseudomonas orientalis]|nr:Outer membrane usher protein FIMD [Pseudomonas orientalis]
MSLWSALAAHAEPSEPVPAATAKLAPEAIIFDSQMLVHGGKGMNIDTSRFERADLIIAGHYRLDLLVNGRWRGVEDIEFAGGNAHNSALPCYDSALLRRAGIDLARSAAGRAPMPIGPVCKALAQFVPGATLKVDLAEQTLHIQVPEYYLRQALSSNDVDPSVWDQGVTAAQLNYDTNLFTSRSNGVHQSNGYAGLSMGLNLGAVRLRHTANLTWSPQGGGRYQRGNVYGQTDLTDWKSQLLVGESSTRGEFFDAVSFRGVQIESDERMLLQNQRDYAPVVRGTASSNARVSIYQRGYLVYETTVAPGLFEIADLQAASFGGDLNVTVTEADGQKRSFVVPFATTVQLLRPGSTRFNATVGQVVGEDVQGARRHIFQGTLQHGLDNSLTAYGGAALSEDFWSGMFGSALNSVIGGFALDLTLAQAQLPQGLRRKGSSLRLSYSKNLPNSGTHFSLLAYRYSTSGFLGLRDAMALHNAIDRDPGAVTGFAHMRNRLDANISQRFAGGGGSLYLNGSSTQYWNQSRPALSLSLGYSNQWRGNSYTISAQRTQGADDGAARGAAGSGDTLVSFSLSIPLGRESHGGATVNSFASHDRYTGTQVSTGLSGTLDDAGQAAYAVSVAQDGREHERSYNASLNYRLPKVSLGASVSQGQDYQQGSISASGALLAHPGGVTLAQTLGETVGVIKAPGAQGARVGYGGSTVDSRGYAVVTSLTPYQLNNVEVDPHGMPDDVELKVSSRSVAPRAGAVVMLDFATRRSRPVLINSTLPNGDRLPFAATAIDVQTGKTVGAVGQGSRLVVRTEQDQGSIRVEWGDQPDQRCAVDYQLPEHVEGDTSGFDVLNLICHPVSAAPQGLTS